MIKSYINRAQNLLLKKLSYIRSVPSEGKVLYLTFDDGPEDGITEFVLSELNKYGYKGTFFCRGDNAANNKSLLLKIQENGHSIGNHTYHHIDAYDNAASIFAEDVEKANLVLNSPLFRPPHGSLNFAAWIKVRKKYKIIYWSLNSADSDMSKFDYDHSIENLKCNTKPGDIVLFHFCHRHEKETRQLLPEYLEWLHAQGYVSKAI